VQRRVFEGDRRGSLASLTGKGRALLRKTANDDVLGLREHFLKH
jgi:DNA-binding MarR family transcriptional regulator